MKINFQHIVFCTLMLIILGACSKVGNVTDDAGGGPHVEVPNDTISPILSITTPSANQVFTSGNTINVTGRITDDLGLYRGSIKISNDANGGVLKEQLYEIHGIKSYDFNVSQTANVTASTDYTATVTFEDHGFNATSKSVKIKVNP